MEKDKKSGDWVQGITWSLICLAAFATLVIFHHMVLFETWSDENIHLYVASQVAAGHSLYGDIHSARPPLALAPLVGLLKIGVAPLIAARLTVLLAVTLTGGVLLWGGMRLWSRYAGVMAAVLFLMSAAVASRASFTGINLVALWTTLCVVFAVTERPLLAGLSGGAALMTGQHAIVIVGLAAVIVFLQEWRKLLHFVAGCAAVVAAIVAVVVAAGGTAIWNDLVGHHLYHLRADASPERSAFGWFISTWLLENLPVLLLACFALIFGATDRQRKGILAKWNTGPVYLLALCAAIHLFVVALIQGGQILYVQPAFPLLALLAGAGVHYGLVLFRQRESDNKQWGAVQRLSVSLVVCFVAATVAGWNASSAMYSVRDGKDYPLLPHLRLWEMVKLQHPVVAQKIAAFVERDGSSEETLFGHATIVTLVALKTDHRIAAQLGDFDSRWLDKGMVARDFVIESIEQDNVAFFITPAWFFVKDLYFREYLGHCYDEPVIFPREPGSGIPRILVFEHKRGERPCNSPGHVNN